MGLDYEQSLSFFRSVWAKRPKHANDHARDWKSAALVSRVSRLRRSTLVRACTPLTKSEEKERLLAVYNGIQTRNTGEMIMGSNPVFRLVFHNSSLN